MPKVKRALAALALALALATAGCENESVELCPSCAPLPADGGFFPLVDGAPFFRDAGQPPVDAGPPPDAAPPIDSALPDAGTD